jgi:hypothetical protein
VIEGQRVAAGEVLVTLADNAPVILERLRDEQASAEREITATRNGIVAVEAQIASMLVARQLSLEAAEAYVHALQLKSAGRGRVVCSQLSPDGAWLALATAESCRVYRLLEKEAGAGVEGSTGVDGPDAVSAASIDPLADMEQRIEALFAELNGDALRFQQLYYAERRYLEDLDKRRRAGYEEVLAQPAI